MKWTIAFLVVLASIIVAMLIARLPAEQAIRLAGYAATAALAALVSYVIRRRGNRARKTRRVG
ncbi:MULTISPECIES: hypothetical protein [Paraburkholderia]|jgi:hypothetical protein|uniref:DUF2964 domain-containing protein n=1 Tax=Paraburkholderia caledonica TaxID=134536 RepID=A0ABU1KTM6_9BURK|nr:MULTISPECIES: hypothetical protein [Paraburkholderia]MDR6374306.1 hypothetical protein [Paraburkholderia caledonica]CAD6513105.1 hypothetical protein LMG28727_00647 [Paraburkholderia kirstenboschensis]CAH2893262.1 MAG: FIG00459936: hypothetical protein [uncultured Paraburkholderia sp.]CAH2908577.1 MAG: FIG00459936: hypothetical protein [uncultured Paraburkholderia sp.]